MRLSTSLTKDIMESVVGGLLYKFKLGKRRHVLFFEDIVANYIRECEKEGFTKDTEEIGKEWGFLIIYRLASNRLKVLPPGIFLNTVMGTIWAALGLMDNFHISKTGTLITVLTENEGLTRVIGENRLMTGFYAGILSATYHVDVSPIRISQSLEKCEYTFGVIDKSFSIEGKEKSVYDKLNTLPPIAGVTLKDALEKNIVQLKNNRIYFRNKSMSPVENTLFHIMGNRGIILERLPTLSLEYFRGVVEKNSSDIGKLALLKNLLQSMGWGAITITYDKSKIIFEIKNPPYGLQTDEDNWNFLIRVVLGYLWLLDKGFKIGEVNTEYKRLAVVYSR